MIRDDLSNEAYHADTRAIGNSGLKLIARSPAHYYAQYIDPHRVRTEPTPAQHMGTCWHYAALEPEKFAAKVVCIPGVDRRTKAGKEAYAAFLASNPGKLMLANNEYTAVCRMADALHAHPAARVLLSGGITERSFYWTDPETGMLCKCRPDYLRRSGSVIVDLKSAEDARPDAFGRAAWNYRYYVQAPWYLDGMALSLEQAQHTELARPDLFVFVVQEKEPPYSVMVYEATRALCDAGRMEYQRNLTTYAHCMREGYWPSYPEEILPLELPSWALRNAARALA